MRVLKIESFRCSSFVCFFFFHDLQQQQLNAFQSLKMNLHVNHINFSLRMIMVIATNIDYMLHLQSHTLNHIQTSDRQPKFIGFATKIFGFGIFSSPYSCWFGKKSGRDTINFLPSNGCWHEKNWIVFFLARTEKKINGIFSPVFGWRWFWLKMKRRIEGEKRNHWHKT